MSTMTVVVVEQASGLIRVPQPVQPVPAVAKTGVRWSDRQKQLARIAAGRREPIRLCCGVGPRKTKCPCRVRVVL